MEMTTNLKIASCDYCASWQCRLRSGDPDNHLGVINAPVTCLAVAPASFETQDLR